MDYPRAARNGGHLGKREEERVHGHEEPLINLYPAEDSVDMQRQASSQWASNLHQLSVTPLQEQDFEIARQFAREESLLDVEEFSDLHPLVQKQMIVVNDWADAQSTAEEFENRRSNFQSQHSANEQSNSNALHRQYRGRASPSTPSRTSMCVVCEEWGDKRFHCNVCNEIFCHQCWLEDRKHKKGQTTSDGTPHEQTDPEVVAKIKTCLRPRDDLDTVQLHREDESTKWFGVTYDQVGELVLEDFGRFASVIAEGSVESRDPRYPGLVSFVGQTGAGKSTIIKMLIELQNHSLRRFESPVVGSVNKNGNMPTSGDVHMYSDPLSFWEQFPILYADCEGLQGGEREPLGAKSKHRDKDAEQKRTPSFQKKLRKLHQSSKRELQWADTAAKKTREFAVGNLYPRLLFTFSDTIVFVSRNARVIENTIEHLIHWAAAALETSSNQPMLPHLILVLNASAETLKAEQYDVDFATKLHMDVPIEVVRKSPNLLPYVLYWERRNKPIHSALHLLHSYYRTVRIVRIPTGARPKIMHEQISKLYKEIELACASSREQKRKARMLLSVEELQPYLQYAFDHFAQTLEIPFDFVKASFTNNKIPNDFGGNILRTAINITELWENKLDAAHIFTELSNLVASCIMLDAVRNHYVGDAKTILEQRYLEFLDDSLHDFAELHWPCEFVTPAERCVNRKVTHGGKGHQLKTSGKVAAFGEYVSSFSPETFRTTWITLIYTRLDALLEKHGEIVSRAGAQGSDAIQIAFDIHRNWILRPFFQHVGSSTNFISHLTCYSCLIHMPEHALPCGHIICTECLQSSGEMRGKCLIHLSACPLEHECEFERPWEVVIKPRGAGVRVLSLDGGGVRGIAELEILRNLEKALGGEIAIQKFFDLIVGTSAGGLIGLLLGVENWPVEKAVGEWQDYCENAFKLRRGMQLPLAKRWIPLTHNNSKYETTPLQNALQHTFKEEYLFGGQRSSEHYTKVALVATNEVGLRPIVLSNYNTVSPEDSRELYTFQRPEKPFMELKTWEAARASSAAPTYFKPFSHAYSKQVYLDGGLRYNNPVMVADLERRLIWPDTAGAPPDILLSVGSGYCSQNKGKVSPSYVPPQERTGAVSNVKSLYRLATDHIESSLDAEETWATYLQVTDPGKQDKYKYRRLNADLDAEPPQLDDVGKIQKLGKHIRDRFTTQSLKPVADQLIATNFFFERTSMWSKQEDGGWSCNGLIQCRFPPNSTLTKSFGKLLRDCSSYTDNPCFVIEEEYRESFAEQVVITKEVINDMIRNGMFGMKVRIKLYDDTYTSNIRLCLEGAAASDRDSVVAQGNAFGYPISGFPRRLYEPESTKRGPVRQIASQTYSRRRTSSQRNRRLPWDASMLDQSILKTNSRINPIASFSDPSYRIGGATAEALLAMDSRFHTPSIDMPSAVLHELAGSQSSPVEMSAPLPGHLHYALPPRNFSNQVYELGGDDK